MSSGDEAILHLRGISKSFATVPALENMHLDVHRGRVHTLLGENGAGKSTLMKILAGVHRPDRGEMRLNGALYRPDCPRDAFAAGVAVVFQELSLSNNLTVAQNIFANHEPSRWGFIDERRLQRKAARLISELGLPLRVGERVASLSMAKRQLVEIAKALSHGADVVIFDEPTSSLSDYEAEIVFSIIASLTAAGKAVLYISHRMEEIMRLSDEITVMRDGKYMSTLEKHKTSIADLIALMVGRPVEQIYPPRRTPLPDREPVLRVVGLTVPGKVENVGFDLCRGEILGFFALVGAGRSDVMNALFGILPATGAVFFAGRRVRIESPGRAIALGIGYVTENRQEEGLVATASVMHNITMAMLPQLAGALGFLDRRRESAEAEAQIDRLDIRAASTQASVETLSGGNQQKIVLAKWLSTRPRVLILDEPTRGIDVAAKFAIYRLIRELASAGTAIIMVSSELPEVLGMSDRIAVMAEKKIRLIDTVKKLSPQKIIAVATGRPT